MEAERAERVRVRTKVEETEGLISKIEVEKPTAKM